jgi:hypothetical protein
VYRDINVLSLIPDRPGRGGTKFGYHAFQQEPLNDTREIKNVSPWQDSWRSDRSPTSVVQGFLFEDNEAIGPDATEALALHGYSKFSLSDPLAGPATVILGHNIHPSYGGHIWNYSDYTNGVFDPGTGFWTGTTNIVATTSAAYPAVFQNIGNRCFIARGDTDGIIFDASRTNELATQGPGKVYRIGVGAPTAAPVVSSSDVIKTAEVYVRDTSVFLSHPDPSSALSTAVSPGSDTLGLTADGVTWPTPPPPSATAFDITAKTTVFPSTLMTVSIANGTDIATMSPPLSIPPDNEWVGLTLTVQGESFVMMAFGNATPAETPALTFSQVKLDRFYKKGQLPLDPGGGGGGFDPADDIINEAFEVTGIRWTMQRGGVDVAWAGGVSADNTVIGQLIDAGGRLTWAETPPSYAYAWYDPITGHISNISPVFAPDSTSETEVGIRVKVDTGDISYPTSTSLLGTTRWTHILFFRTLMAGGSTLYPIGSLDPDSTGWQGLPNGVVTSIPPAGTNNYWYDSARDADLLISGALRAPQFTNNPPRVIQDGEEQIITPAHMAYWDGRLWIAGPQDYAALHYSCDRTQCPFGIPEESFPDTNVLRIPASDGCIRGMKLIGENLLVTTERWAYTIAGNNESNYRLVRISTRMAGVGDYQMDEFVSDVEGGGALVVFIGSDAKVYAMPLGGQAVWISKDVQTFFDSARLHLRSQYQKTRVHCMDVAGQRLVLVYCPAFPAAPGKTLIYDFDARIWSEHTLAMDDVTTNSGLGAAWATISTQQDQSLEIYAMQGRDTVPPISPNPLVKIRNWFNMAMSTPIPSGYARTFPLTFDGKKTRKQVHFIRLYVNDKSFTSTSFETGVTTYGWRVTVRKDSDATGTTITPLDQYDPAYRSFPPGSVPVDASTVAELIVTDAAITPSTPLIGYTFDITVTFPGQTNKLYQLYKMEIGWSTVSDGQVDL